MASLTKVEAHLNWQLLTIVKLLVRNVAVDWPEDDRLTLNLIRQDLQNRHKDASKDWIEGKPPTATFEEYERLGRCISGIYSLLKRLREDLERKEKSDQRLLEVKKLKHILADCKRVIEAAYPEACRPSLLDEVDLVLEDE